MGRRARPLGVAPAWCDSHRSVAASPSLWESPHPPVGGVLGGTTRLRSSTAFDLLPLSFDQALSEFSLETRTRQDKRQDESPRTRVRARGLGGLGAGAPRKMPKITML